MGEGKENKTMTDKIVNDTVSYIKTIAKTRGRNVDWAEKAVRKSVSITEEEAVKLKVIDFISPDVQDLLAKIDGKVIKLDGGDPDPSDQRRTSIHSDELALQASGYHFQPHDRLHPSDAGDLRGLL